jgi:large conductance mechanosensitive channel
MLKEFKQFALKGNMIDLAVGIIIGGAFSTLVSSLVSDVIMPLLSIITSRVDFTNWFIALDGGKYASLDAATKAGAPVISYGLFISGVINFLIMAFVVFIVVKWINKLKKPEPIAPVTTKPCPFCFTDINNKATKCPSCTADIPH